MSVDRAESVEELESLGATWILDGMVSKKGERRDGRELYQKKVRTLCTFPTNDQRRICEKFSPWNSLQPLDEKTSRVHVETVSGRRRHHPLLLRHSPIAAHTCRYPWIMDLNPPPQDDYRWLPDIASNGLLILSAGRAGSDPVFARYYWRILPDRHWFVGSHQGGCGSVKDNHSNDIFLLRCSM